MDHEKNQPVVESGEPSEVTLQVPFPEIFVYSNATAFSLTAMDIRIGFGEAMPNKTVEARVGIVMPIEHAAHLALSLISQLAVFEKYFGAIRLPAWQVAKAQAPKPSVTE